MLFKSLRRRSASSNQSSQPAGTMQLHKVTSSDESGPQEQAAAKEPKEVVTRMSTAECRDYEEFLEKAKVDEQREEERKKEALRLAIRDADRRRRNAGMDPWSRRL